MIHVQGTFDALDRMSNNHENKQACVNKTYLLSTIYLLVLTGS